jgi:hypothetical protein
LAIFWEKRKDLRMISMDDLHKEYEEDAEIDEKVNELMDYFDAKKISPAISLFICFSLVDKVYQMAEAHPELVKIHVESFAQIYKQRFFKKHEEKKHDDFHR